MLEVFNIPSNTKHKCINQFFSSLVPVLQVITEFNRKDNSLLCFLIVESFAHANFLINHCNNIKFAGSSKYLIVRFADKRNDFLLNPLTNNPILWPAERSFDPRTIRHTVPLTTPPSMRNPSYQHSQFVNMNEYQIETYTEGPQGANLFIYHLPQQLNDADLITLFSSFGCILSATVNVDKKTGASKGYGFVSFASPESASKAIHFMNGFCIGNKRLKVEHKKKKR